MTNEFRTRLAEIITAKPDFITRTDFRPHPELVDLANEVRSGRSLKEVAIRAWTYQDTHADELPIVVAARMRTIYRRIHRHLNQQTAA